MSGARKKNFNSYGVDDRSITTILDEPTSPLDPQTVDDFLDIIKKLSDKANRYNGYS